MNKNKHSDLKKLMKSIQKWMYKKKYLLILITFIFVLITTFFGMFKIVFFFILFIVLNIITSIFSKILPRYSTSLELNMLGTVLMALAFGPKVGALFGFIASILYYYGAGRFSYFVITFAPSYALIGLFVGLFSGNSVDLFTIGMICTVLYSIVTSIAVFLLFNARLEKMFGFFIINLFFNFIMFKYIAPLLYILM